MIQTKQEMENWYKNQDPWGYEANPHDMARKEKILGSIKGKYKRALDVCAGEGFITRDLPAKEIEAIEISDIASSRFPSHVKRVHEPIGKYDLIILTGALYAQYDAQKFIDWIREHASGTVVLSNIADWELPIVDDLGKPKLIEEYPYREYIQRLRVYDFKPSLAKKIKDVLTS